MKRTYVILAAIFLGFFALGLPDGAFGVAWPYIRQEYNVPLERAGFIFVVHSIFYALTTSCLGVISRYIKEEKVGSIGLFVMVLGLLGFAFASSFFVHILFVALMGTGMGLVDGGFNAFVAKHYSGRVMNLLHCFWGVGAMVSPLIMTYAIVADGFTWRIGYGALAVLVTVIAVFARMLSPDGEGAACPSSANGTCLALVPPAHRKKSTSGGSCGNRSRQIPLAELGQAAPSPPYTRGRIFLKGKWNEFMAVLMFFFYGGAEYGISFWVVSVLTESRGMSTDAAGIYPAAFYGAMMAGRLLFVFFGTTVRDVTAVRFGIVLSIVGLVSFLFTTNIFGILLIGFGFGPVIPCAVSEVTRRFEPASTSRLVGYQFAALGGGVAILATGLGWLLSNVSLEILFPAVIGLVVAAGVLNEILEKRMLYE